jgi:hypothetical protein
VYNSRTKIVMESINVVVDDETPIEHLEDEVPHIEGEPAALSDTIHAPSSLNVSTVSSTLSPDTEDETMPSSPVAEVERMPMSPIPNRESPEPSSRVKLNHLREDMLGNVHDGLQL